MKNTSKLILGGLFFLLSQAAAVSAQTLTVSATIPAATGLSLTVTPVTIAGVFGTPSTTATTIPFGTLTFNSTLGIYLPADYYAIDIGTTGGAGTPIVNITYAEGTNPNNPGGTTDGLGTKTTATFDVDTTTSDVVSALGKKRLIDLTGTAGELPAGDIPVGDWERVYIGVWSGSTTAPADPSNGKPFSNTDVAGTYTGTLTFTVVTL